MSRLDFLTIFIVVVCLGALGYLVYKTVQLMNPPGTAERSIEDSYNLGDDVMDWPDTTLTGSGDTDVDPATGEDADDKGAAIDDPDGALSDRTATRNDNVAATPAERTEPARTPTTSTTTTPKSSSASSAPASSRTTTTATASSGRYSVVAGAFSQRANADREARRIRNLGYANAEVSSSGQYAVVVVNRYSNLRDAEALVRELATKNVKAFVKVRQ